MSEANLRDVRPSSLGHQSTRPVRRAIIRVALLAGLGTTAAAGYAFGRGALTIPSSVAAAIPAPLVRWGAASPQAGHAKSPAELKDFVFELVVHEVKQGEAVLTVQLVDKRSGQLVDDAVVFARRLDMAPEGMATMTGPLEALPATRSGLYPFKTDLPMEGSWRLSLGAKVQGKTGTVRSRLVFEAVP